MLEFKDGRQLVFPRDRVTIQDGDRLYDWYGREIEIDEEIKRVLEPLGSKVNGSLLGYDDNHLDQKKLFTSKGSRSRRNGPSRISSPEGRADGRRNCNRRRGPI